MKNAVPFRAPTKFAEYGIEWTRPAQTETERKLREAFLTYEMSCGPNGLVSILLLATVSRRQGSVAEDLQAAADHVEILLGMKLRKHQHDTLNAIGYARRTSTNCQTRRRFASGSSRTSSML